MSLERRGGFVRRQATQWRRSLGLLPRTDVFHFYFGLTLVPRRSSSRSCERSARSPCMHYLGLRHPGKDARRARIRKEGGSGGRRLVRRDPLGARGGDHPARDRRDAIEPVAAGSRSNAAGHPARALVAPPQGHRAGHRRVRGARRRPRPRGGPPPRRGVRALPRGRHRGGPAQRRLVRPLRDRVHGARQAGRVLSPRGGGASARRRSSETRVPIVSATKEIFAPSSSRWSHRLRSAAHRSGVACIRRASARPRAGRRPPARALLSPLTTPR